MNKYKLSNDWPNLPGNYTLGSPTGLGIDGSRDIVIFHRAGRTWSSVDSIPGTPIESKTILVLDRETGKIRNSWGDNFFLMPHGLTVDPQNNIWLTDVGLHQVFKFSYEGELLMTIGEARIAGNDTNHFNMPTDVVVSKDGSFYASDGYGNSRIIKFSASGEYLFEWGKPGDKEGEFNLPHAIELDDQQNVYVADRENNRIQIFSPTGEFINQWASESFGKVSSVVFNEGNKKFFAVDYISSSEDEVLGSEIICFDPLDNSVAKFGGSEGLHCWYHNIAVDDAENIYVTDILGNEVRKFIKV